MNFLQQIGSKISGISDASDQVTLAIEVIIGIEVVIVALLVIVLFRQHRA